MRETTSSNIPWVGEIPTSWKTEQGKHFMTCLDRPVKEDDGVITCFRDGEVTLRSKRREEGFTISFQEFGYQGIEPGDLVVHGMDGFAGAIGISDSRGKATPVLTVLDTNQDKRYMMYALRNMAYTNVFLALSTGIRVRSCDTSWKKIKELRYALPPLNEQKQIADQIEIKCSQVNSLIANQEAQIEKLKQYKQSLITEVVTKGLDPDAPMKDSGVWWIGEINSKFNLKKIKYFINDYKAGPFGSALITGNLLSEGNILVYTPEHIANQSTENSKNLYLPESRRFEMEQFFVSEGNIIFPIVGSLGRAMYISSNMPVGIINQRLAKFRIDESVVDKDYFLYVFAKSNFYKTFLEVNSRGAIIVNLTKEIVYNMPFVVPSIEEQRSIVRHLDRTCACIDSLIRSEEHTSELQSR